MRRFLIGVVSLCALSGCATVSMAPASMMITASVSEEQSAFRDSCETYSEAVYSRGLVAEKNGLSQVFKMLAFGDAVDMSDTAYRERIQLENAPTSVIFKTVSSDAAWAKANLDDLTLQVSALLETSLQDNDSSDLRKDIVAYEEAIILSKKARVSFIDVMSEFESRPTADRETADLAIKDFETSIDRASRYIDKLSQLYAELERTSAAS